MVFADTSALYALLDRDDQNHAVAAELWKSLIHREASIVCTNYVLVEVSALLQHRLGIPAVRTLQEDIVPMLDVQWTTEADHQAATAAMLTAASRRLSLVDCVSLGTMRTMGIQVAFAFDRHFEEQGFDLLASGS